MTATNDWNASIIDEFRSNEGKVGGQFEGAPMVLVHNVGRKSGTEFVSPLMYQPGEDSTVLYIFASAAGAPKNPDWYYNVTDAGETTIEVGAETYPVIVTELTGADRDKVFAEQVKLFPGFGEYEEKTAGIRTIPVLELRKK